MLHAIRSRLARSSRTGDDGGFVLLESIISITLIVIVMAGMTNFFVSVTKLTSQMRIRQSAVMIADGLADQIRGYQPSDTYLGRAKTLVTSEFTQCGTNIAPTATAPCAPTQVVPYLSLMSMSYDNSGDTPKLPMSSTQVINGKTFNTFNYIGSCQLPIAASDGTVCKTTYANTINTATMLRVVVGVFWSDDACNNNLCTYITDSLISADSDPTFLANQTPPASPVISNVANQTSAINDSVSLQMTLTSSAVVAPVTWSSYASGANTLPAGLTISNTGLITGTPSGPTGTQSVTITATDAFGRYDTQNFSWTILPDLVITGISQSTNYTAEVGKAITALSVNLTGGTNTSLSATVPLSGTAGGLPGGLVYSSSAKTISGTPTTAGSYTVTFTESDSSGRKRTYNYTWTVYDKATISITSSSFYVMPAFTASQKVNYTCPIGTCTITFTSTGTASNGMATTVLSTSRGGAAATTTTSGVTSVTVNSASGSFYLTGTPTTPTASGSPATTTAGFTVAIADTFQSASASSTWTLFTGGTNTLSNASVNNSNGSISFSGSQTPIVSGVCATTTCAVTLSGTSTGTPSSLTGTWLSTSANGNPQPSATISIPQNTTTTVSSFWTRGNVTTTGLVKTTTYNMTVTITDTSGNTLTEPATWTIS